MTLKELRLGNWVRITDYYNTPINVEARGKYHQFTFSDAKIIQYLEPIPLSEELLLKCGFEKWVEGVYLHDNISVSLSIMEDNTIEVTIDGIYRVCVIKYLHQLQNIYFNLVGEELEVKI